jgi:hypothetical protein
MAAHLSRAATAVIVGALCGAASAQAQPSTTQHGATIGLLVTHRMYALYETADRKECPDGFNTAQIKDYTAQFPTPAEKLAHEREYGFFYGNRGPHGENVFYNPTAAEDSLPFHQVNSTVAIGLNLDGKVGPSDFTSPEGQPGIDNQLYRVLGCIEGARKNGSFWNSADVFLALQQNRLLFEVSGIDDWQNDPDVVVRSFRGRNPVYVSGANKPVAGGTEHVDYERGSRYMFEMHGRIENGVLKTDPIDFLFPWTVYQRSTSDYLLRGMRLEVKLTPEGAKGLIGGYADIKTWYPWFAKQQGAGAVADTNHWSPPSFYKALSEVADAYPDPQTGRNTAVSMAVEADFIAVNVVHRPEIAITQQAMAARTTK